MHSTSANHGAYAHGQYLAYGTASPKYSGSNTQNWGNNPDPRSVPPLPANLAHAGSRRKSKEASHQHPHTYTTSPPERYALKSPGPGIKMEYGAHRAQYSGWNDGEQDEATYGQQTEGVADYWYHGRHDSKQRSGAASPNYAYSKPAPTHRQSIGRNGHPEYYATESYTEPRTQRGNYNDPNIPWGLDATVPGTVSDAAAQKAVHELFPELTGGVENVDYYTNPSYYVEPPRRYSNSRRTSPPQTVIAPSALTTAHKVPVQENAYYPSNSDFLSDAYDEHDFSDDTDDETTMSNFPVKSSASRVSPTATLETPGPATPHYHGAPSTPRPRRPANEQAFDETDALLVQYRKMGVSYKAIKAQLGLDEAESTLRGRYRTLTKPKSERLRKPVWNETDLQLLIQAVDPNLPHVKWKQVADSIVQNGGSYRFGSSTCKKQYIQLVEQGRAPALLDMGGHVNGGGVAKRRKAPRTRV